MTQLAVFTSDILLAASRLLSVTPLHVAAMLCICLLQMCLCFTWHLHLSAHDHLIIQVIDIVHAQLPCTSVALSSPSPAPNHLPAAACLDHQHGGLGN